MKASEKHPGKITNVVFGFATAAVFLFGLAACQPEDEIAPASAGRENLPQHETPEFYADATLENLSHGLDNYDIDDHMTDPIRYHSATSADAATSAVLPGTENQIPIRPDMYNVIRIDHFAGRSRLPDYSVTVRSDGLVIYEGRRNVWVQERVAFLLSGTTLPVLKEIFDQSHFYQIKSNIPVYADAPFVRTTYQPTLLRRPVSISDNYENEPAALVRIRLVIENILGISKYVYHDFDIGPAASVVSSDF